MENTDEIQNGFVVDGAEFKKAVKILKKAFPRKKKDQQYVAGVFEVAKGKVSISMPGAKVYMKAIGYGYFSSEIPFALFKGICNDQYSTKKSYAFLFDHGSVSVEGISYRFPEIVFNAHYAEPSYSSTPKTSEDTASSADSQDSDISATFENTSDEVTGYLGLPLLGVYYQLRGHPPHTFVNPRMMAAEAEIENILSKVDRLLKPLGLGRHTIEKILDDRSPRK